MARAFRPTLRGLRRVLGQQQLSPDRNLQSHGNRIATCTLSLSTSTVMKLASKTDRVEVTFIDRDGDKMKVQAQVGQNLLEVAQENGIDVEGRHRLEETVYSLPSLVFSCSGACEGVMACSTCHLIIDPDFYCKLDDEPTEEEMDMLDLAYGLSDTSRLGCQVMVTKDLDNMVVTVPAVHRDARTE